MLREYFICAGKGYGQSKLNSFDEALRDAGLANYNLVKVSSILPAGVDRKPHVTIQEGSVLYTAYASISSSCPGDVVSAAIAVGLPLQKENIGVIMEYSGKCDEECARRSVCSMVEEAMRNRGYEIKEILCYATSTEGRADISSTAFAAIAMW